MLVVNGKPISLNGKFFEYKSGEPIWVSAWFSAYSDIQNKYNNVPNLGIDVICKVVENKINFSGETELLDEGIRFTNNTRPTSLNPLWINVEYTPYSSYYDSSLTQEQINFAEQNIYGVGGGGYLETIEIDHSSTPQTYVPIAWITGGSSAYLASSPYNASSLKLTFSGNNSYPANPQTAPAYYNTTSAVQHLDITDIVPQYEGTEFLAWIDINKFAPK